MAGHVVSAVRRQEEMNAGAQLFLLLIQSRIQYRKWCLLVYAGSSYLDILIKNAYTGMPAGSFTR